MNYDFVLAAEDDREADHDRDRRPDRRQRPGRQLERAVPEHLRRRQHGASRSTAGRRTRRARTSPTSAPMEIMRDMGVEGDVIEPRACRNQLMGDTVVLHEPGRRGARAPAHLGHAPARAWPTTRSPARPSTYDMPQTSSSRSSSAHAADARHAGALRHRVPLARAGRRRRHGDRARPVARAASTTIRAKYLIGADGGRSQIAQDIGLPMEGEMDWAGSMNIVFHADLSQLRRAPPERPVLGACSRAPTSAASAWASCGWCARGTSG